MFEPDEVLQTLTGRGHVSAAGIEAVRVRYKVVVERREGAVRAYGTLTGAHAAMLPIWLIPDSVLRLKTGHRIDISMTDLVGDVAEFESVGPVSRF